MRTFLYVIIGVVFGWWATGWGIWALRRRWYVMAAGCFTVAGMNIVIWSAAAVA